MNSIPVTLIIQIMIRNIIVINKRIIIITIIIYNEGTPLAEVFSSGALRRGLSVTLSIFLIVGTVAKLKRIIHGRAQI